jgi:hypothetical protein
MARIVDSSDEEFPDVTDLVRGIPIPPCGKSSKATTRSVNRAGHIAPPRNYQKDRSTGDITSSSRQGEDGYTQEKGRKAMRRCLKQTSDNPLLRPLDPDSGKGAFKSTPMDTTRFRAGLEGTYGKKQIKSTQLICPMIGELGDDAILTDSDGLSDFIVDDISTSEFEISEIEEYRPKATRRLVKGHRPSENQLPDIGRLGHDMLQLSLQDSTPVPTGQNALTTGQRQSVSLSIKEDTNNTQTQGAADAEQVGLLRSNNHPTSMRGVNGSGSAMEDPFAILRQ